MSEWISVKDRLPETPVEVLVFNLGTWVLAYWNEDVGQWILYNGDKVLRYVTHWMPLPEPPEEVE